MGRPRLLGPARCSPGGAGGTVRARADTGQSPGELAAGTRRELSTRHWNTKLFPSLARRLVIYSVRNLAQLWPNPERRSFLKAYR